MNYIFMNYSFNKIYKKIILNYVTYKPFKIDKYSHLT